MSGTVVPDLLRLKNIPTNLQQRIETDVLETSTFQEATNTTAGFARFDLQKKGWLHSHSKLFLSLVPAAGDTGALPPTVGIGSVIQRAVLKVGNAVLNEITDWNFLHEAKSAQINNETGIAREQFTTGRCMATEFIYRELLPAGGGNLVPVTFQSRADANKYGMSNGRDYSRDDALEIEGADLRPQPVCQMVGGSAAESPVYSVDLSDLFPFLATHSLPLYMIDQQMSIELHWSPMVNKRVILDAAATADGAFTIDRNELKFCADYIFYTDSDLMQRYADANPRIEFSFPDYRLSKQTVTDVQLAAGVVTNVGMANRLCSRVITMVNQDDGTDQMITGPYKSVCPPRNGGTGLTGAIEYNVRYNDRFEFPTSITNKSRLFSHHTQSEGLLFVTRDGYSNNGNNGYTAFKYFNRAQNGNAGVAGNQYYLATRLTNGRVGVRGIELHYKAAAMVAGDYTLRTFIEYNRLASLEGGLFTIMNA